MTAQAADQLALHEKTSAVIALLQESKKTDFKIADTDTALDLFHELAHSFKKLEILKTKKPWKVHLSALVDLASEFLNLSREIPFLKDPERLSPFFEDLENARTSQSAHYTWFITFIDALSIANTDPSDWFDDRANTTKFDTYHAEMIRQTAGNTQYIRPEIYRQKIATIGNTFTRKFVSTKGASRCFPDVVILPFPFSLNDENLVNATPTPAKPLWPAGFNLSSEPKIDADGESMSTGKFFSHDVHAHFAIYRSNLSTLIDSSLFTISMPEKNDLFMLRKLFFQCVTVAQDMIQNIKKQEKEAVAGNLPEKDTLMIKRRLISFFSFLLLHESRNYVEVRLKAFALKHSLEIFLLNSKRTNASKLMTNHRYYRPLLPPEWQSDTRAVLKDKLSAFSDVFLEHFAHQSQLSFPHDNLVETLKNLQQRTMDSGKNRDPILFDPSAYQLSYSLEYQTSIKFYSWAAYNQQAGYRRLVNKTVTQDVFGAVLSGNHSFYRFTYFDLMALEPCTPDTTIDKPDLIEQFISSQHPTAQNSYVLPAYDMSNVNASIDRHENTRLMWAIATQNIMDVEQLLIMGADVNSMNIFGDSPLLWAAYEGNGPILEKLLKSGANVHVKDRKQNTPLHVAAKLGNTDCIKHLLQYGANIKEENNIRIPPIGAALTLKQKDAFKLLLEKEDDLDQKSGNGTSLFMGMIYRFPDLAIDALDTHHPNLQYATSAGFTPLTFAIRERNADLVKALIQHGAPINQEVGMPPHIRTPLNYAIQCHDKEMVALLIELGADINYIPKGAPHFSPPIFLAIATRDNDLIHLFMRKEINLKQCAVVNGQENHVLNSYLLVLEEKFNIDTFERLLINGAPIHESTVRVALGLKNIPALNAFFKHGYKIIRSNDYFTPFFIAARDQQDEAIRLFLAYGEVISAHDLMNCVTANRLDVLQTFFTYNPDLSQTYRSDLSKYYQGHTLLTAIIYSNLSPERKEEFIRASVAAGAHIDQKADFKLTPLHGAVEMEDMHSIRLLLSLGANPANDIEDHETCFVSAIKLGRLDIIEQLLKAGVIEKSSSSQNIQAQYQAIIQQNTGALELLLSYGMDINGILFVSTGYSPLHYFVAHGNLAGVKLCLLYDADLSVCDKEGMTALDLAKKISCSQDIIDCITQYTPTDEDFDEDGDREAD